MPASPSRTADFGTFHVAMQETSPRRPASAVRRLISSAEKRVRSLSMRSGEYVVEELSPGSLAQELNRVIPMMDEERLLQRCILSDEMFKSDGNANEPCLMLASILPDVDLDEEAPPMSPAPSDEFALKESLTQALHSRDPESFRRPQMASYIGAGRQAVSFAQTGPASRNTSPRGASPPGSRTSPVGWGRAGAAVQRLASPAQRSSLVRGSMAAAASAAAASGNLGTPRGSRPAEVTGQSSKGGLRSTSSSPRGPLLRQVAASSSLPLSARGTRSAPSPSASGRAGLYGQGGSSARATTPRVTSSGHAGNVRTPQRCQNYVAPSLVSSARVAASSVSARYNR